MRPVDQTKHENDLHIDMYALEEEWAGQPRLFRKYSSALADANREFEETKNDLELCKAECSAVVRGSPHDFGMAKVTENGISAAVLQMEQYKEAQESVIDAKHAVDVLKGMTTACDHRRSALENEVRLFLAGYYADPKAPEGEEEAVAEMEKKSARRKGVRRRTKGEQ